MGFGGDRDAVGFGGLELRGGVAVGLECVGEYVACGLVRVWVVFVVVDGDSGAAKLTLVDRNAAEFCEVGRIAHKVPESC